MQQPVQNTAKAGVHRKSKNLLHIDMTPMVDLGFLLITFFIFTSALSSKNSMSLTMPKQGLPIGIAESKTLSILLTGENKILMYEGIWDPRKVRSAGYEETGLRSILNRKQQMLEAKEAGSSKEMVVIIKPLKGSSYADLINVLDEMLINDIGKYAVVDPTPEEISLVASWQ